MRIDITEKNMVWLVEHKMADTIVAEFHRKEAVIESLIRERDEARDELASLRASSFVTAVPSEEYEKLKAENKRLMEQRAKLIKSAEELFRFVGVELWDSIEHFEAAWEAAKGNPPPDDMDFQEQQDIRLNR